MGATGAQGGAVTRALLADGKFWVRAVTRDASSPKAKNLAELGADVVEADVNDPASLREAYDGAYGAFCVTFFWEHMSVEREHAEAQNMATAAKATHLQHVVWSTLEDTRGAIPLDDHRMPTIAGRYKVPHFDGKSEADAFFFKAGVPTTFLQTTFYWENLLNGMGPTRSEGSNLELTLPLGTGTLAGISTDEIGAVVAGIFNDRDRFVDKTFGIAGDFVSGEQIAAAFSEVTGEEVSYHPLGFDDYRKLGFPAAEEFGNMFQYYAEFPEHFLGRRSLELVRELNPSTQTFREWLAAHRHAFANL